MVQSGKEPVFSMVDDTPPSVLSTRPWPLFTYFKQLVAPVTNPPVDPIREELLLSLTTPLGWRPHPLGQGPDRQKVVRGSRPRRCSGRFRSIPGRSTTSR